MENRDSDKDEARDGGLIQTRLDEIARGLEKTGIAEYMEMLQRPRRLLWLNFWIGLARGFGMAIGFTILAAVVLYLLRHIIALNIPLIGKFVADIVEIVQNELHL
ncbi:MAG: DUF5665 domain-containing protein [Syntrophomonas sp.]